MSNRNVVWRLSHVLPIYNKIKYDIIYIYIYIYIYIIYIYIYIYIIIYIYI